MKKPWGGRFKENTDEAQERSRLTVAGFTWRARSVDQRVVSCKVSRRTDFFAQAYVRSLRSRLTVSRSVDAF